MSSLLKPVLKKSPGRVSYGLGLAPRLIFGTLTLLFSVPVFIAPAFSFLRILAFLGAFLCYFAAASRDAWFFYSSEEGGGGLSRVHGTFPASKGWELPLERLASINVLSLKAGEVLRGINDDHNPEEDSILGGGRGPWAALLLVLDDGRRLVLASGKAELAAKLRADGEAIATFLDLPLVCPAEGEAQDGGVEKVDHGI